jgi:hypothetical protein
LSLHAKKGVDITAAAEDVGNLSSQIKYNIDIIIYLLRKIYLLFALVSESILPSPTCLPISAMPYKLYLYPQPATITPMPVSHPFTHHTTNVCINTKYASIIPNTSEVT